MSLKKKRILITAGPTWVALDPVRVISNTASGETGRLLARALSRNGARITLLLGPGEEPAKVPNVTVKRFQFFDELAKLLKDELMNQYDVVIHSAAVSDYRPEHQAHSKIKSDAKFLTCRLVRTPKLIDLIKKIAPNSYAIGFKYDPRATGNTLMKSAKELLQASKVDAVIANTVCNGNYLAQIVTAGSVSGSILSKNDLVKKTIKLLSL